MSLPTSIGAYKEEIEVFDRAIATSRGIRVPVASANAANHFRMRLHQARQIDRRKNAQTYPPDHPLYNSSIYDPLVITIGEDAGIVYIYLKVSQYVMGKIEELDDEIEGEVVEQRQIEDHMGEAQEIEDDFAAPPRLVPPVGIKRRI